VDLIPSVALSDSAGNDKQDASYYSGQLILGFKLTDAMAFEGGIIYQHGENTVPASLGPATDFSQQSWIYYLQMLYSPAKNVYIVPEIGIIDYDKLKVDGIGDISLGDQSWFGIKWQISF
jgi:hypothetical protein